MAVDVEKVASDKRAEELKAANSAAAEANASREGVGTRMFVGSTRGKGSIVIKYENWDKSSPDTLPKSLKEFMEVTKITDQSKILEFVIDGHNDELYQQASDPIAEFVDATWPDDAQAQFRLVVRNLSRGANLSIEDAVSQIKPLFEKQYSAK